MRSSRQFHNWAVFRGRAGLGLAIFAVLVCSVGCTGNVKQNNGVAHAVPGGGTPGGQERVRNFGRSKSAPSASHNIVH